MQDLTIFPQTTPKLSSQTKSNGLLEGWQSSLFAHSCYPAQVKKWFVPTRSSGSNVYLAHSVYQHSLSVPEREKHWTGDKTCSLWCWVQLFGSDSGWITYSTLSLLAADHSFRRQTCQLSWPLLPDHSLPSSYQQWGTTEQEGEQLVTGTAQQLSSSSSRITSSLPYRDRAEKTGIFFFFFLNHTRATPLLLQNCNVLTLQQVSNQKAIGSFWLAFYSRSKGDPQTVTPPQLQLYHQEAADLAEMWRANPTTLRPTHFIPCISRCSRPCNLWKTKTCAVIGQHCDQLEETPSWPLLLPLAQALPLHPLVSILLITIFSPCSQSDPKIMSSLTEPISVTLRTDITQFKCFSG